jgi:hypothetical protein
MREVKAMFLLRWIPRRWGKTLTFFLFSFLFLLLLTGLIALATGAEDFWHNFALNLLTELIGVFVIVILLERILLERVFQGFRAEQREWQMNRGDFLAELLEESVETFGGTTIFIDEPFYKWPPLFQRRYGELIRNMNTMTAEEFVEEMEKLKLQIKEALQHEH